MKHLRTLAVLPMVAAAAQAYTLEFQLGQSNANGANSDTGIGYNNTSLVGVTWAMPVSKDQKVNIGINLNNRSLSTNEDLLNAATKIGVFTTSFDLSYDLNPRGGISPFIGAGIGYAWLSNKNDILATASNSALSLSGFAGVRFNLSKSMDFTLTARNNHLLDVKNSDGSTKRNIQSWESIAGLRFKF